MNSPLTAAEGNFKVNGSGSVDIGNGALQLFADGSAKFAQTTQGLSIGSDGGLTWAKLEIKPDGTIDQGGQWILFPDGTMNTINVSGAIITNGKTGITGTFHGMTFENGILVEANG